MAVASQHKRKTNHERFEEDRDKLAIGYRLSAIGYRLILALSLGCIFTQVQAQGNPNKYTTLNNGCKFFDGFADNGDGTVTDPRDGLIWKQCAEGTELDSSNCTGSAKSANWFDAMELAKRSAFNGLSGWRLPTASELKNVVGVTESCSKSNQTKYFEYAASNSLAKDISHDIDHRAGIFWSSSSVAGNASLAGGANFSYGVMETLHRGFLGNVRLVRASQFLGSKATLVFNREYHKMGQYRALLATENQQDKLDWARRATEQAKTAKAREAQERRESAERVANACNAYYQGKSIGFKPASFIYMGNTLDAVVLGTGNGNVSIKIVDRHFTDLYGKTLEMSCTSDQLQ